MSKILSNDFKKLWLDHKSKVIEAVNLVGESGWYILGQQVRKFEEDLSKFWNVKFAIGCANGLDAIEIGLRALGVKKGDKVLTTPMTAFATTLAILRAEALPVFVDIDGTGAIDLDLARKCLTENPDIKFMVPVHLFGHCLDLDKLKKLKADFNLKIVEDCAQSIGAKWNNLDCGNVGDIVATSFYPTKNLGCIGDGGAILCHDENLYNDCRVLRDYGQSKKYEHTELGLNSRLDELQAAILSNAFLPSLKKATERRAEIATRYLKEITNPKIKFVNNNKLSSSAWHLFPLLVENRSSLQDHLKNNEIETGIHYPILVTDQKAMNTIKFDVFGDLTTANRFAAQELSIPIHPYLENSEVSKVIDICNKW